MSHYYHKPEYYKLWVENGAATEGDKVYFKVKLSDTADHDIKVYYKTYDGTANAYHDYKPEEGYVTIRKGTDYAYIDVRTIDDTKVEGTEYFNLKIREYDRYVDVKDDHAKGTIYDNDFRRDLKLSIEDAAAKEGEKLYFKVKLDHKAYEDVTIYYKTEDGTAKAYHDYKPEYGKVVIKAGTDYAYIDVKSLEDHKVEGNEYFKVKIWENERGVYVSDGEAKGTIIDDDYHKPPPHHDYHWGA